MSNRLANEPSPYLQQHKDNPVDWWPWSDDALEEARQQDKPLFVSIGYSACHWCHVMAHESFEHPELAAFMNEHFLNVKVDREERPDVDTIYMNAVQAMVGHGGWPLNVFATADGVPFFGGTYWPPVDARGMPGFVRVLETIATAWQRDRESLLENARRVTGYLESISQQRPNYEAVRPSLADEALETLGNSFDSHWGGFGSAPKFPQVPTLDFLARHLQRTGSDEARRMLTTTLDRMAAGGIHDHLAGGFARYSVDAQWVVPHFEKMLYDNAQLIRSYLEAWKATGTPRYAEVVRQTGNWLLTEMQLPGGGLASALDADSEGVEGKFYVWSDSEIHELLDGDVAEVVHRRFGIAPAGNFEGNNILTLAESVEDIATSLGKPVSEVQKLLDEATARLRERRSSRVRPGQDDKVVTAWNGLAVTGLALVGAALRIPRFVDAAEEAARFMLTSVRNDDGTLWRTWKDGERRGNGVLEDYIFLAEGLIHLHQATGKIRYLDEADAIFGKAVELFNREGGADFYDTPAEGTGLAVRPHTLQDNATPAGNSVAADVLLTLSEVTSRSEMAERAEEIVSGVADLLTEHPGAFGRYLAVAERLYSTPYTLVIAGDPTSDIHRELTQLALAHPQPSLVVTHATPKLDERTLHRYPVLQERAAVHGVSTGWLCRQGACMLPATTVDELQERLRETDRSLTAEA
ncbi:MAG TPA: thioredoxin domain-containing protein [Thermomicrobiales bacterium]|nr:thioredoxin domain-containing protein [Thermomicrobiales bacterium]